MQAKKRNERKSQNNFSTTRYVRVCRLHCFSGTRLVLALLTSGQALGCVFSPLANTHTCAVQLCQGSAFAKQGGRVCGHGLGVRDQTLRTRPPVTRIGCVTRAVLPLSAPGSTIQHSWQESTAAPQQHAPAPGRACMVRVPLRTNVALQLCCSTSSRCVVPATDE